MAYSNHATTLFGDSIIKFPLFNQEYAFFGVGKVLRISKGQDADIVYVAFYPQGKGDRPTVRRVIVGGNHPRRQLLTLKCGQYAQFYGRCVYKNLDKEIEINGKIIKPRQWELFAYALQGWYVPNAFDVRKAHKDKVDEELYTEMTDEENTLLDNIIDEIMRSKGEDDE